MTDYQPRLYVFPTRFSVTEEAAREKRARISAHELLTTRLLSNRAFGEDVGRHRLETPITDPQRFIHAMTARRRMTARMAER